MLKKLTILIVICLFVSIQNMNSQGFNWQFNSRFPNMNPKLFVGIQTDYTKTINSANIPYNEGSFNCCEFSDGNGNQFSFGLIGEFWYYEETALTFGLNYSINDAFFSNQRQIPRREYFLVTNYELSTDVSFLNFEIGIKQRFPNTFLYGGVNLKSNLFLSESLVFNEIKDKQTPSEDPFQNRYNIPNARISEFSTVNFAIGIFLGYDFSIMQGIYFSPNFEYNVPLNSLLSESDWFMYGSKFKIKILKNF